MSVEFTDNAVKVKAAMNQDARFIRRFTQKKR